MIDRVRVTQDVERVVVAEPPHVRLTIDVVDHLAPRCGEITQTAKQGRHVSDVLEAGVADDDVEGSAEVGKAGERRLSELQILRTNARPDRLVEAVVQVRRCLPAVVEEVHRVIARPRRG